MRSPQVSTSLFSTYTPFNSKEFMLNRDVRRWDSSVWCNQSLWGYLMIDFCVTRAV